ncbi:MAG: N-acetyltransferase [Candidatus Eremiobacteraeota bacterium]|nr:N-acetyltransferase [Candidatus Eremiobacteraeota bacterium]
MGHQTIRRAQERDLETIRRIYNEGIEDRVATLDEEPKSEADIAEWWARHQDRHAVLVAERDGAVVGWAALNPYHHRCAYAGVADLSIYVAREARGTGVGTLLLRALEEPARSSDFYKIVLFTFPFNEAGQRLYKRLGYREVGVFKEQGRLDGRPVDVVAMEKLLTTV